MNSKKSNIYFQVVSHLRIIYWRHLVDIRALCRNIAVPVNFNDSCLCECVASIYYYLAFKERVLSAVPTALTSHHLVIRLLRPFKQRLVVTDQRQSRLLPSSLTTIDKKQIRISVDLLYVPQNIEGKWREAVAQRSVKLNTRNNNRKDNAGPSGPRLWRRH